MKLFKIVPRFKPMWQSYVSAIVCAKDEKIAQLMHPLNGKIYPVNGSDEEKDNWIDRCSGYWCENPIKQVRVIYLGEAQPRIKHRVICAEWWD